MQNNKVLLITGASGFLGGHLISAASSLFNTFGTYHSTAVENSACKLFQLDITDKRSVDHTIDEISPDIILHCAAITNSNYSALHHDLANSVNVIGTEHIARGAKRIGARLIYMSTDLVFRGDKSFSKEDDSDPICYYGKTKLEGERIVASVCPDFCVARTAIIYGRSKTEHRCFTETIIDSLRKGEKIRLFSEEYRTPVYVKNLCDILLELAAKKEIQGVYNIAGLERISRYRFGLKIADIFGFDKALITPMSVKEAEFKDPRPLDCSMDSTLLRSKIETKIMTLEEGLIDLKKGYKI